MHFRLQGRTHPVGRSVFRIDQQYCSREIQTVLCALLFVGLPRRLDELRQVVLWRLADLKMPEYICRFSLRHLRHTPIFAWAKSSFESVQMRSFCNWTISVLHL